MAALNILDFEKFFSILEITQTFNGRWQHYFYYIISRQAVVFLEQATKIYIPVANMGLADICLQRVFPEFTEILQHFTSAIYSIRYLVNCVLDIFVYYVFVKFEFEPD